MLISRFLHKSEKSFDKLLTKELGFSPALLAIKLLQEWGYNTELCLELGIIDFADPEFEDFALDEYSGAVISQICEVGEALARASRPDRYPSAKDDWRYAKTEIEKSLGSDGMRLDFPSRQWCHWLGSHRPAQRVIASSACSRSPFPLRPRSRCTSASPPSLLHPIGRPLLV